jgi:regulatory protein
VPEATTRSGGRSRSRGQPREPKSCHERALGLLAVRPRSRRELEQRLTAAGFGADEVADVLGRLERVGLVDDADFARQLAEQQFVHKRAGRRAVTSALIAKGIAPDLIEAVVAEAPDDEEARAEELARSKALRMGSGDPAKAFNRLFGLLMRRGYAPQVARQAARRALGVGEDAD